MITIAAAPASATLENAAETAPVLGFAELSAEFAETPLFVLVPLLAFVPLFELLPLLELLLFVLKIGFLI